MLKNKTYLVLLFFSIILIIIFSIMKPLKLIYNYKSNRMYDLRKIDEKYRLSLMQNYVDNNFLKKEILILGDSQSYGFLYPNKYVFSNILENKINKKVINCSGKDFRILDAIEILKYVRSKNLKIDYLIYGINESHLNNLGERRININNNQFIIKGAIKEPTSFIKFVYDFSSLQLPNEKIEKKFSIRKNEKYFNFSSEDEKKYFEKLKELIFLAKNIAEKDIIFYTVPHPIDGLNIAYKNRIESLNTFSNRLKEISEKEKIIFFNPNIFNRIYFRDIVHFNIEGHKQMANKLSNFIVDRENLL